MTTLHRPRVYLHIGEPKTGTTFLQQVMWRNRTELAAQGVVLPGHHPQDHFWATQDLRGIEKLPNDPAGSWSGEWDILAAEALQAERAAVISHELFSAAEPAQVARAVESLSAAELHVVLTVRDMATLLPAEWQETVKHGNTRAWDDWLADVIDDESIAEDRRQFWFWRVHDTLAILDSWSQELPRDRVHVITRPRRGAPPDELWRRFATVVGVDPDSVDATRARANSSLGLAETEFLRRFNAALSPEVPGWFYMWNVKETVAHRTLANRPRTGALTLPDRRFAWAGEQGEKLVAGLQERGFDLVGDLDDLLPVEPSGPRAHPDDATAEQVLDASIEASAALVLNHYRRLYPAVRPQSRPRGGLAERVEAAAAASPRVKQAVRTLSGRYPAVRRMRVTAWRLLERTREKQRR